MFLLSTKLKIALLIIAVVTPVSLLLYFKRSEPVLRQPINTNPAVHDEVDADGIRPDVRKEIEKLYPSPGAKRDAAVQLARVLQKALRTPEDAPAINKEFEAATACILAVDETHDDPPNDSVTRSIRIESFVVNSAKRAEAYLRYNAILSDNLYPGIAPDDSQCIDALSTNEEN